MFCCIKGQVIFRCVLATLSLALSAFAAPIIDPIGNISIPAGKSLIIPVTATSPNGRPLTFMATSSMNGIAVIMHTNNPFWKMSVVQAAPSNAPGVSQTPFRGGFETVTNIGDMTFMLFRDIAPHTIDVIQGLTASGLYTSNTIFHRVIAGFMIQGGDPMTNGTGGPVFRYDDEWNPQAIFSGNGQLALANSGKDTDGSQFFVTVAPYRSGDFGYTIFGQLLRGFNVLSNINNTAVDANSRPLSDEIITRASFVPDNFDTVLTLIGTNLNGVAGTIRVIADDGAGGRATNSFIVTTVTDGVMEQAFIYPNNPNTVTNLVAPVNVPLTNFISATNLQDTANYWFDYWGDSNSTNSTINATNGELIVKPNLNFIGSTSHFVIVSTNSQWNVYYYYYGINGVPPYDLQLYTFAFGDTPVSALATNFTALALTSFTNQLMATFTNGVPNSNPTNFTAFINWGDNSTNSGVINTNLLNQKEVLGAHTYTNAGTYPVYVTIQSYLGAAATVVSTASVPPSITLTTAGTNNVVAWPAWATDYQLQSAINLAGANWQAVSNFSALNGYSTVVTNGMTNAILFFRLEK
jgi:cyclophilin family peptidyl-prolyl cis-trans isomerase